MVSVEIFKGKEAHLSSLVKRKLGRRQEAGTAGSEVLFYKNIYKAPCKGKVFMTLGWAKISETRNSKH